MEPGCDRTLAYRITYAYRTYVIRKNNVRVRYAYDENDAITVTSDQRNSRSCPAFYIRPTCVDIDGDFIESLLRHNHVIITCTLVLIFALE